MGECNLKAIKPNSVIPPLLFGLGIVNDMVLIQKTLLTEISKLGYAISYDEVKRYKQLVLMDEDHKLDHILSQTTWTITPILWKVKVPSMECTLLIARSKSETFKRKVSIKLHWYQGKAVCFFSK